MGKTIIINLGNKGAILSLKNSNSITESIFIEEFNQSSLPKVLEFFNKYKKTNAYILLDSVAQNYNYKIFPPLNYFDLQKIVNRRFSSEIPKTDLKKKHFLYKENITKKTAYLFVSASMDSPLKEWIKLFDTIPNNLLGIYMIPLEIVFMAKKILMLAGTKKFVKEKNQWVLLTIENQINDFRQVAIFNGNIAFTRLISIDKSSNLSSYAKNDIIRASEYIKRFDSEFNFEKLAIINITSPENKNALKDLKIEKSVVLNYTTNELAQEFKIKSNHITPTTKYCDMLISLFIFKFGKKIRFSNIKIDLIYNLNIIMNIFNSTIILFFASILISLLAYVSINILNKAKISHKNREVEENTKILKDKSKDEFGEYSKDIDRIIDVGTVKEAIDAKYVDPIESFEKFNEIQDKNVLTTGISWTIENFDYQGNPTLNFVRSIYDTGIINPDGNVNKLFSKYDIVNLKLRNSYKSELINLSTLPSNIDFNKIYKTYPIKIELLEKKMGGEK